MYKYALVFVGGFASGIAAVKIAEKVKEKRAEKESWSEFQADDGDGNPFTEVDLSREDYVTGHEDESSDIEQDEKKDYSDYAQGYTSTNYTRFIDSAKREHPKDDENEEDYVDEENEDEEVSKWKKPKLIKEEEFGEMSGFEQETLKYFVEDDILCTEENEVMKPQEFYIGDALTKYGFKDNPDETTIYVRNGKVGTDYEIVKIFGSYEDWCEH